MSTAPADVTLGRMLLSMASALQERWLGWLAVGMAFGVTVGAMVNPIPWRCGAAAVFVALVSPLWLRRAKRDGA